MTNIQYDLFINAFLQKISEFDFLTLDEEDRNEIVEGYMHRAISEFSYVCSYDLVSTRNDELREFEVEIPDRILLEIINIVTEGMLVQWMKPYMYNQELLQNVLNTRDYTTYSPSELLYRVTEAYKESQQNFTRMIREYSYRHGDLTVLHL
nr:MAG TPA: hypothetical protein [Caudoviricetes sp.]